MTNTKEGVPVVEGRRSRGMRHEKTSRTASAASRNIALPPRCRGRGGTTKMTTTEMTTMITVRLGPCRGRGGWTVVLLLPPRCPTRFRAVGSIRTAEYPMIIEYPDETSSRISAVHHIDRHRPRRRDRSIEYLIDGRIHGWSSSGSSSGRYNAVRYLDRNRAGRHPTTMMEETTTALPGA